MFLYKGNTGVGERCVVCSRFFSHCIGSIGLKYTLITLIQNRFNRSTPHGRYFNESSLRIDRQTMASSSMRLICIAAALVAVAYSLPERQLSDGEYETMWQGFTAEHGKVYHPEEVMTRFEIFKVTPSPRFVASAHHFSPRNIL